MAEKSTDKRYVKATSGFLLPGGRQIRYGDLVAADDPMFRDHDGLMAHFEPVTPEAVEQATRAPGEVRILSTRRPPARRKSAAQESKAPAAGESKTQESGQESDQGGLKESGE